MQATHNPAMAEAMKDAGVAPPLIQRVWNVVKESGRQGVLFADIKKRLRADDPGSISYTLNNLHKRGMLVGAETIVASGHRGFRYTTDMDAYELLPLPAKPSKPRNPMGLGAAPTPAPVAAPAVSATPGPAVASPDKADVFNAMSLGRVMQAWIAAGMDPSAMLLMPVSQFIRAAAKCGLVVTLEGGK